MFKLIFKIIILIYLLVATFFAWQYFNEPELKVCLDFPQAKLYQQIPEFLYSTSKVDMKDGTQSAGEVKNKLAETVSKANELVNMTRDFSNELDLENVITSTGAAETNSKPLQNKIVSVGQYMYCQNIITNYENSKKE